MAAVIAIFSVLAVTGKKIVRSAIYLLFVLLATAGLFLLLDYHFLFAVQVTVYAGGIMVLFIMAIFLTHKPGDTVSQQINWKRAASLLLSLSGLILCGSIVARNVTRAIHFVRETEINMEDIGHAMLGTDKHQYLLPFEMISILLLACIVGAIMIARKDKNSDKTMNNDTDY